MDQDLATAENGDEDEREEAAAPAALKNPCPVVGIGVRPGGLDAVQAFFGAIPGRTGMAFVAIQPRQEPSLPEQIARQTDMPVHVVVEPTQLRTDEIYVVPPDVTLELDDCTLRVVRGPRGHRRPIDSFFRSLAEDQGDDAVGIVLAGTGGDGAGGLKAIKEHGGLALVQSPVTVRGGGRAYAAILARRADAVLPVGEMAVRLQEHLRKLSELRGGGADGFRRELEEQVIEICSILYRKTGHDFSGYKRSTLVRRIRGRMVELRQESVAGYLDRMRQDDQEVDLLFSDLLIRVTHFFRDPDAFEALARKVVPKLFDQKGRDDQVRVWVPGCSTGEEAYSLAILLREHALRLAEPPQIQVFATDIDSYALEVARHAWYPESSREHLSPERVSRFFIDHGDHLQVSREIREMCLFSTHNLIADPPFSRLDLISCRNLLIYLEADLQKKLVPLCHYALRSRGFLFLGPSENVASWPGLFLAVDRRHRIFQSTDVVLRPPVSFQLSARNALTSRRQGGEPPAPLPAAGPETEAVIRRFEAALHTTKDNLQATLEELESSNEELAASNEELQAANDKLQTSKEELQAVNEELETINAELNKKVDELDRAHSDLHNLFEGTEIATLFVDRSLRIKKFTPAATAVFRLIDSDVGRSIADIVPRFTGAGGLMSDIRKVLRTLARKECQVRLVEGDSWYILRILPYRTVDNVIDGVVMTFVDITERKEWEETLRQAARRKDEFLAMLGHELRNPLAPIRSSLHVLAMPNVEGAQAVRARATIERQVLHLTHLVDDLLDVSRISQGKILLRKERIDLAELLRATVEDHRGALTEAGLRLEMRLPLQPLWVHGDPTRLAQAVGNVLHNAGKFTDRGGEVSVAAAAEMSGPQRMATITVRDTGIGIAPEVLAELFEPFSQAPPGLDRERGGLGLGLALVRRLVELHGGAVEASSEGTGRGAEIRLHLPLDGSGPAAVLEPAAQPVHRPRRCLIIEDNRDAAESMAVLLELTGHEVTVAHDGRAGVAQARLIQPEVVVCDIGLPGGLDGYAVARALRADPELAGCRLIALTGYGQEEDQRRAREAGFDVHLTKPADPEVLRRLIAGGS
jgi:chemotaxis methyl-accepting protein methylase/signal transduction histidine kinase